LRFFSRGKLLLETSLCWECTNCYVRDGSGGYEWLGFYDADKEFFKALQAVIPSRSKEKE
jgi:hypothetical protein